MRTLLIVAGSLILLLVVLRLLVVSVGQPRAPEPAGVVVQVPAEYALTTRGELTTAEAAAEIRKILAAEPARRKLALRYRRGESELHLLVDLDEDRMREWKRSPSGTVMETSWEGEIEKRLARGEEVGDFSNPDLPPPTRRNLYH